MRTRFAIIVALATGLSAPAAATAKPQVMGYYPYWESGYQKLPWRLLDTVAFFGASVDAGGNITATNGWPNGTDVAGLIARANSEGVRIVLTVTNFDHVSISSLVNSATARKHFIDKVVPLVLDNGGDGISIDFEFVDGADRAAFTQFMTELAAAFHNADPQSNVSITAPAVDWTGGFDVGGLLSSIDDIFIMAYNYHYAGGDPGPVAPLAGGMKWSSKLTISGTISTYLGEVAPAERSKLILGLPLYGFDWPAASDQAGAAATGKGKAVLYKSWLAGVAKSDVRWDMESATPWFVYNMSGWHQVWGETATSLAAKIDAALASHLGGFGFWALGYDGDDPALWNEVAARVLPDGGAGASSDGGVLLADAGAGAANMSGGCACRIGTPGRSAGGETGGAVIAALFLAALAWERRRRISRRGRPSSSRKTAAARPGSR